MAIKITGAARVPLRRAFRAARSRNDQNTGYRSQQANGSQGRGKAIIAPCCSALRAMVDAMAIQAIIEPQ